MPIDQILEVELTGRKTGKAGAMQGSSLLLLIAIVGAIFDFQYVRRGGERSTRREKIVFWSVCAVFTVLMLILGALGWPSGTLGSLTGIFVLLIFATWEFGRWQFRRKHPINPPPPPPHVGPQPNQEP